MKSKVLIVDDDIIWLGAIQKQFDSLQKAFLTLTADSGATAMQILKANTISLVVTDLQMPEMDGLDLMAYMSEHFPDIPVIIMTAYGTPSAKKAVLDGGAFDYLEKPIEIGDLIAKIQSILKRESEGGTLQTVPLDVFLQLIEMEAKTCTIRVLNKRTNRRGVLFFRDGDLMDARYREMTGKDAAYKVFSWDKVTLSIQDDCALTQKRIDGELQAILFEAMRRKDETDAGGQEAIGSDTDPEPAPVPPPKAPTPPKPTPAVTPARAPSPEAVAPPPPQTPMDRIRATIGRVMGGAPPQEGVYEDKSWTQLLEQAQRVGVFFSSGPMKCVYLKASGKTPFVVVADKPPIVVNVDISRQRDQALESLAS